MFIKKIYLQQSKTLDISEMTRNIMKKNKFVGFDAENKFLKDGYNYDYKIRYVSFFGIFMDIKQRWENKKLQNWVV